MNLAVFDLDGTLTRTTGVDDACFLSAMHRVLGLRRFDTDWANYPRATDEGLVRDICRLPPTQGGLGRDIAHDEAAAVRREFLAQIALAAANDPSRFAIVHGAPNILHSLAADHGWAVAIATGAWRESAVIKLRTAGMLGLIDGPASLPAAFAGTPAEGAGAAREEIVNLAIGRAAARAGVSAFDRVVCIGDGVWDLRTARHLGHGFVGVGAGDRRDRLLAAGAAAVLPDYAELPGAVAAITGGGGGGGAQRP